VIGLRAILVGLVLCAARSLSHADESNRDQASAQLVAERCGICHTTDLVTQQRLDRSHWTATVDKMIRWGAPLSPEERNALLKYLAAQYSPERPVEAEPRGAR
jgi:mono/diheme cytochrome c family protein